MFSTHISYVLGGFGLFLFGINYLSDSIKYSKHFTIKLNNFSTLTLYLSASLMTFLCQSSSAVTAIIISLIKAEKMNLKQAAIMIVACNIATTITPFITLINLQDYSLLLLFVGAFLYVVTVNKLKLLSQLMIGIALLFYGLQLMSNSLVFIANTSEFVKILHFIEEFPLLFGTLLTALIQSSSVSIAIVQQHAIASQLPLLSLWLFIYGANIGTTSTAFLVSLGDSIEAKKCALIHLTFNVLATLIAVPLINCTSFFINFIATHYSLSVGFQIALVHLIFNIQGALLFFIIINPLCVFLSKDKKKTIH